MRVTASRLGSAPITVDWSQIQSKQDGDAEVFEEAWGRLKKRLHSQDVGFYDAPIANEISQAQESIALAETLLKRTPWTDCLFLGIGGSCLGPKSLLEALQEHCSNGIRFHFLDNPDPIEWKTTLSKLRVDSTLVCSVTKSGTTFETMAQTLLALEWLGKERWKTHFVAITDPQRGDLRAFAEHEGLLSLSVHPSMGGRFSIFSPVGFFAAALAGLSVPQFVQGAKQVRDYIEKTSVVKNPLFVIGSEVIQQFSKRNVHVMLPYSARLKRVGDWFVQLWSESLGKEGKGFTPLSAVGPADQHSILQLLKEGPDDKITFFLTVDQVPDGVMIPKAPVMADRKIYPAFRILEGHSLQELVSMEYRATSLVLTRQARPHLTLQLDRLDERSMGALYFTFAWLTAFTGTLWQVDPFNQPGVEEGKLYIREALSQEKPKELDSNSPVARLRGEF